MRNPFDDRMTMYDAILQSNCVDAQQRLGHEPHYIVTEDYDPQASRRSPPKNKVDEEEEEDDDDDIDDNDDTFDDDACHFGNEHYAITANSINSIMSRTRRNDINNNGSGNTIQAAMRQSRILNLFRSKLLLCWISSLLVLALVAWHSSYTPFQYHHLPFHQGSGSGGIMASVSSTTIASQHPDPADDAKGGRVQVQESERRIDSSTSPVQLMGISWKTSRNGGVYDNNNDENDDPAGEMFTETNHLLWGQDNVQAERGDEETFDLSFHQRLNRLFTTNYFINSDNPQIMPFMSPTTRMRRHQLEREYTTFTEPQEDNKEEEEEEDFLLWQQQEQQREQQQQQQSQQQQLNNETTDTYTGFNSTMILTDSSSSAEDEEEDSTDDNNNDIDAMAQPQSMSEMGGPQHLPPKNPAVYGWTPAAFPNPLFNPIRCAIAYLPQFMDHPPPSSTTSNIDTYLDAGGMISPLAIHSSSSDDLQQQQQKQAEHPLRLCDPDWVLGGSYLEQIAVALNNFTTSFGREHHEEVLLERQQEVLQRHSKYRNHLRRPLQSKSQKYWVMPWADLALATARKMDLTAVLRDSSYYAYEDEDDMVNDAAQIFARGLHDAWWPTTITTTKDSGGGGDSAAAVAATTTTTTTTMDENALALADHGILIFLSIQDRVCFICTGPAITPVLPWWRLDHIITSMKPALRERDFGAAVLEAIASLSDMLQSGPPSMMDRLHDFLSRFGVVILFATVTFVFGAWGEHRDRRKRFQFAEERSQLNAVEREKACLLQKSYQTRQCPICLESFFPSSSNNNTNDTNKCGGGSSTVNDDDEDSNNNNNNNNNSDNDSSSKGRSNSRKRENVDSHGIPLLGADGKRIKILRCGHIFCESCWKSWVHSGCGNPCNCPVCRQDVGRAPRPSSVRGHSSQRRRSAEGGHNNSNNNNGSETTTELNRSTSSGSSGGHAQHRGGSSGGGGSSTTSGVSFMRMQQQQQQPLRRFNGNAAVLESHPSYDSVAQSRRLTLPMSSSSTSVLLAAAAASAATSGHLPTSLLTSSHSTTTTNDESHSCEAIPNERQPLLLQQPRSSCLG